MKKSDPMYGKCFECREQSERLRVAKKGAYPFFFFCHKCREKLRLGVFRLSEKP